MVDQVLAVERWHRDEGRESSERGASERGGCSVAKTADALTLPRSHAPTLPAPPLQHIPLRLINNLVIMGMGEPLANYDPLLKALRILNASWGGGIGARKITVSTSSLAPRVRKVSRETFKFRL